MQYIIDQNTHILYNININYTYNLKIMPLAYRWKN